MSVRILKANTVNSLFQLPNNYCLVRFQRPDRKRSKYEQKTLHITVKMAHIPFINLVEQRVLFAGTLTIFIFEINASPGRRSRL